MTAIAVLMTCFNRVETTLKCLRRLHAQKLHKDLALDVWLVDDASPDGTGKLVSQAFPDVHVIDGTGGLFWARGMHLAWESATQFKKYDFFLWLNDDLMLYPKAIAQALRDLDVVGANAVIVGACASIDDGCELSYGVPSEGGGRIQPNGRAPEQTTMAGMNGNFVLIPYEVYERTGLICGEFYHGMADWDYGYTLMENGIRKFCASHIVGSCPQQPERYFHLKGRSLSSRIKLLFNPKGFCLHDAYLFKRRHFGILRGILSVFHITFKVVFAIEKDQR